MDSSPPSELHVGFDPFFDIVHGVGVVDADGDRLVGAVGDAAAAAPAVVVMNGPAVDDLDGAEAAGVQAGAAAGTVVQHFHPHSFHSRHETVQVVAGHVFEGGHHAAAGTAEADTEQLAAVRGQKNKIVHPHLAGHGHQPGVDGPLYVGVGLFPGDPAADAVGNLEGAVAHEQAADVMGVVLALPGQAAAALVHDDVDGGLVDEIVQHLGRQGLVGHFAQTLIDRQVGDAVLVRVHPGNQPPQAGNFSQLEDVQHLHGGPGAGTAFENPGQGRLDGVVLFSLLGFAIGGKSFPGGIAGLPAGSRLESVAAGENGVAAEADPAAAGRKQPQFEGDVGDDFEQGGRQGDDPGPGLAEAPAGGDGIVSGYVIHAGKGLLPGQVEGFAQVLLMDELVVTDVAGRQSGKFHGPEPGKHVVDPGAHQQPGPQDGQGGVRLAGEKTGDKIFHFHLAGVVITVFVAGQGGVLGEAQGIVPMGTVNSGAAGVNDLGNMVGQAGLENVLAAVDIDVPGLFFVLDFADHVGQVKEDIRPGQDLGDFRAADIQAVEIHLAIAPFPGGDINADDFVHRGIGLQPGKNGRGKVAVDTGDGDRFSHNPLLCKGGFVFA